MANQDKEIRREFPLNKLIAQDGKLEAEISEKFFQKKGFSLIYFATIKLQAFEIDNQIWDTKIELYPMKLRLRSWKELSNKNYKFPKDPKSRLREGSPVPIEDYVGGSIYLFGTYILLKVSSLQFGEISGHEIPLIANFEIDFEGEPSLGYSSKDFCFESGLAIGSVAVRGDVITGSTPDLATAQELAGRFLDLNDYEAPKIEDYIRFYPKFEVGVPK